MPTSPHFPNPISVCTVLSMGINGIMITLLSDHFVLQPVTVNDLQIASLAWGFTIGFGFLTTWNAIWQTANVYKRYGYSKLNSPYIVMIWLEILVCLIFSVICWLHLNAFIPPRYATPLTLTHLLLSCQLIPSKLRILFCHSYDPFSTLPPVPFLTRKQLQHGHYKYSFYSRSSSTAFQFSSQTVAML